MATARLEKVDEFLTCTICSDIYTDPCTLHCQHTFCRKCITRYTKTRPEALQSKTIPCPCCRQVTEVPDPTKPVDEWAKQLKPSIIIQGLIDTSQPGQTTTETGRCNVCEKHGETNPFWCPKCEMALCDRCKVTHSESPTSHDHEVCSLSEEVKVRRRRKVMCGEHQENCIEFHCKDCGKSACQTCCIIYHRACKSVVTIGSLRKDMTADLNMKKGIMFTRLEAKSLNVTKTKTAVKEASEKKLSNQSQIRSISQIAIGKIKQKEKQLMEELEEVSEKQMTQLQADLKAEEIDVQMYRQHWEFIDQAVNSESVMDIYDVYQASASGSLVLEEATDTDTDTDKQHAHDIRFTHDVDTVNQVLKDLQLGRIDVSKKDKSDSIISPVLQDTVYSRTKKDEDNSRQRDTTARVVDRSLLPSPVMRKTINYKTKKIDEGSPLNVTSLIVNGVQATVVTDGMKACVKSFYTRHMRPQTSLLQLKSIPCGIAHLKKNQVIVAVPGSCQIVTLEVTPNLFLLSTMETRKEYSGLAVITPSSFAAGCLENCVDILNMTGQVMKTISHFSYPNFMCVDSKGNLLVSDSGMHSVTCLTSNGDVVWKYCPSGHLSLGTSSGITTTSRGDVLIADKTNSKVIQLTEKGEFVRHILTSEDGLNRANGIFCTESGSLFVCDDDLVKEFKLY